MKQGSENFCTVHSILISNHSDDSHDKEFSRYIFNVNIIISWYNSLMAYLRKGIAWKLRFQVLKFPIEIDFSGGN